MIEFKQVDLDRAKRNTQAKELADQLSQFVNSGFGRSTDALAILSMQDHPTLLQAKMRFCVAFIELMSQRKGDLRTEASEALARKMIAATTEQDRSLPVI